MNIHCIQTGTIAVKSAHRNMRVPDLLRFPAIIADPTWTEPLPIYVWVIEHPEGLIVIDTGETSRVHQPDYFRGGIKWFFDHNTRFDVKPDQEIGPQMRTIGLSPADVRWVIVTHVHSDHMGGMVHFPKAEFIMSRTEHQNP